MVVLEATPTCLCKFSSPRTVISRAVKQNLLKSPLNIVFSLLILANWKESLGLDFTDLLAEDLKAWLSASPIDKIDEDLRDQLCTGFFCVYVEEPKRAERLLQQLKQLLPAEMFLALGSQIAARPQAKPVVTSVTNIFTRLQDIIDRLLHYLQTKLSNIYQILAKQPLLLLAFCKHALQVILTKIKLL